MDADIRPSAEIDFEALKRAPAREAEPRPEPEPQRRRAEELSAPERSHFPLTPEAVPH